MDSKPKITKKENGRVKISKSTKERAVNALTKGNKSVAYVAQNLNISRSTVKRIKRELNENDGQLLPKKPGRRVFTNDEEKSISKLIFELKELDIKIRAIDIKKIVYGFAVKQGLQQYITKWRHQEASRDWYFGFLKRNPKIRKCISKHEPSETLSSIQGFGVANLEQVEEQQASVSRRPEGQPADELRQRRVPESENKLTQISDKDNEGDGGDDVNGDGLEATINVLAVGNEGDVGPGQTLAECNQSENAPNCDKMSPDATKSGTVDVLPTEDRPPTVVMSPVVQKENQYRVLSCAKDLEHVADVPLPHENRATEAAFDVTSHEEGQVITEALNHELKKFFVELKAVGISPSPSDAKKIRDKCFEKLNAEITRDIPQASGPSTSANPFINLYPDNLQNHIFTDLEITENEDHILQIKTTRKFDKDEFLFEVQGDIIPNAEGLKKNSDANYTSGSDLGKLFFLGILERNCWLDCAKCDRTKAVQNSVKPNLRIRMIVDKTGQERTPRLFFTADEPIDSGAVLKFDFCKQILRNKKRFPFLINPH